MYNEKCPYHKVAKEALVKWNGLTEVDAIKFISQSSFEQIEEKIGAQNSMKNAIDELIRRLELNDLGKEKLFKMVFDPNEESKVAPRVMNRILSGHTPNEVTVESYRNGPNVNREGYDITKLTLDVMEAVHNGWIKDNANLFFTKKQERGQQYQYLPIELIGWDEAKSDLLFIKPIIESMGFEVDEKKLKKALNNKTIQYIEHSYGVTKAVLSGMEKNFGDIGNDITETIKEGKDLFDGNSPWNADISEAFANEQFVSDIIVPQLRTKGFGKDVELMNMMAKIPNPNASNYWKPYEEFEYLPLFYDIDWSHEDGYEYESRYDDVVQALYARSEESKEEFEERISQFNKQELAELTAYKLAWQKMTFPNRSEVEELKSLRDKLKALKEEEKTISEAEKLIEVKENQGPSIDD